MISAIGDNEAQSRSAVPARKSSRRPEQHVLWRWPLKGADYHSSPMLGEKAALCRF